MTPDLLIRTHGRGVAICVFALILGLSTPAWAVDAPTDIKAEAPSKTSIKLTWTDVAGDETSYRVERDGAVVANNLPANTAEYTDSGLTENTTYVYRVAAVKNAEVAWSKKAWARPSTTTEYWPIDGLTKDKYQVGCTYGEYFYRYGPQLGGTANYHWGVDVMRVGTNAAGQKDLVAPFAGRVNDRWGSGTQFAVEIKVGSEYLTMGHLQLPVIGAADTGGWAMAGVKLAEIGDNAYGGVGRTYGAHSHIDRTTRPFGNLNTTARNDTDRRHFLQMYGVASLKDPKEQKPEVKDRTKPVALDTDDEKIQYKGDGAGAYVPAASKTGASAPAPQPDNAYILKGKIDIVAEAEDDMGHPKKPAALFSIAYWVEAKVCAGGHDIRSAATPYVLHKCDPHLFDGATQRTDEIYEVANKRKKYEWDNDTDGHWVVTNTKGTTGAMDQVDQNQYWHTKAKNVATGEPNGVDKGDATKAEEAYFPDGEYRVKIRVSDLVNDVWASDPVWLENFPPAVKEKSPTDGGGGRGISQGPATDDPCAVRIVFSEPMNRSSVESAITWIKLPNQTVSWDPSWDSNGCAVTLYPITRLSAGVYQVTISADVAKDLSGRPDRTGAFLDSEFGHVAHNGVSEGDDTDKVEWTFTCPGVTEAVCSYCPGDMNNSSRIDSYDVPGMVSAVLAAHLCADVDQSGTSNGADIGAFVNAVLANNGTGTSCVENCIPPGQDCWVTLCNGNTKYDFSQTVLPADFFGPGSDPFTGLVLVGGASAPSDADTVVARLDSLCFRDEPLVDTVPIELVSLSLASCEPITVHYGGSAEETWSLAVGLSSIPAPLGVLTATRTHPNGGTFDATFFVQPSFTFTRIFPASATTVVLDTGLAGYDPVQLSSSGTPWLFHAPSGMSCAADFAPGVSENDDGETCCPESCHSSYGTAPHEHCTVAINCPQCEPSAPQNDSCADAILISVPSTVDGSTVGAHPDGAEPCDVTQIAPGVWYRVLGTGSAMTASTCGINNGLDTRLTIFCGGCVEQSCAAGANDGCGGGSSNATVSWCSMAGTEYLILVHGALNATGAFELMVTRAGGSCSTPPGCTSPVGSCCHPDASCATTTANACAATGGFYGGDGSLCAETTCLTPTCIQPGDDCWSTVCGGALYDFGITTIPAGFFGPGSDPFTGIVVLGGAGGGPFGSDTVVRRLDDICFGGPLPSSASTRLQIQSLSLMSCAQIMITSNGGQNPEAWNLTVGLSSTPAPEGTMVVTRTYANGGIFDSTLFVQPLFTFTRVINPAYVRILDTGAAALPPIVLEAGQIPWVHDLDPGNPIPSCSGTDFHPGIQEPLPDEFCCPESCHSSFGTAPHEHCTQATACPNCPPVITGACCLVGGTCVDGLTLGACQSTGGSHHGAGSTCSGVSCVGATGACCIPSGLCIDGETSASCVAVDGIYQGDGSVCGGLPCTPFTCVPGGQDCWDTVCGSSSYSFADNPIPADFFGPGSLPFDGILALGGGLSSPDTLIQRMGTLCFPDPLPSMDVVPIQIVQLSLASCSPINVGGSGTWDVSIDLSSVLAPSGTMTVTKTHANGGTFDSVLPVQARFTFTQVGNPLNIRVFDTGLEGVLPVTLNSTAVPWVHSALIGPPCSGGNFVPGIDEGQTCCPETCHSSFGTAPHEHCTRPSECPGCVASGACCFPNGSCVDGMFQPDCQGSGGTYQGDNTDCVGVSCAVTIGACCFPAGSCSDGMDATSCQSLGGDYQGNGSVCSGLCPVLTCIPAGQDCWATVCGSNTRFSFADNPIPADFFDPGSQPFDGILTLGGSGGGPFGSDTLVQRLGDLCFDAILPDSDTVPLRLVSLNLVSCAPIVVAPLNSQWDVQVTLSPLPAPIGTMIATKTHANGGTFDATFYVQPLFTFTRVGNPLDTRTVDTGLDGIPPAQLDSTGLPWLMNVPFFTCSPGFAPGYSEPSPSQYCCPESCHSSFGTAPHEHCTRPPECPHCATAPGDACIDAISIPSTGSITLDNTSATTEPSDPLLSCYGGGAAQGFGTVWVRFVATASSVQISTAASLPPAVDSIIQLYGGTCGSLTEIMCDEDSGPGFLSSMCVSGLVPGIEYYVELAAYSPAEQGLYQLDLISPCPPACSVGAAPSEAETCGTSNNGGCNEPVPVWKPMNCGNQFLGTVWANAGSRDTDWYQLNLPGPAPVTVTITVRTQFNGVLYLANTDCGALSIIDAAYTVADCQPVVLTRCLAAGQYSIIVVPNFFDGLPCGVGRNNYRLGVTCGGSCVP